MRLLRLPSSFAAAAALICAAGPLQANSGPITGKSALAESVAFLKRMLHMAGVSQQPADSVISHTVSIGSREASLELELAGGRARSILLRNGAVLIDGEPAGSYARGGALERSWRSLLADAGRLDTRGLVAALKGWRAPGVNGADTEAKERLLAILRPLVTRREAAVAVAATQDAGVVRAEGRGVVLRLTDLATIDSITELLAALDDFGPELAEAVRSSPMHVGDTEVPAGQRVEGNLVVFRGNAAVRGTVSGTVVTLFGNVDVHEGGHVGQHAFSVGGSAHNHGGAIGGRTGEMWPDMTAADAEDMAAAIEQGVRESIRETVRQRRPPTVFQTVFADVRDVVGVFIALAMTGFGTVFFGRRYIEVVSDTARHSFGRSFVVGFLGQLLLLPTFAMLIVGLVFTIVGILLLPFAAVAFVLAAVGAALGGYLAIAHAVGETFTRRRMANGAFVRAPNAYGYLFSGLIGLLGLWAAAALFGWAGPVVILFRIAAMLVTWVAATAGFGAVLLSRAGLRETFAGRHYGEMSDEYLWATPPATPTAARMGMKE